MTSFYRQRQYRNYITILNDLGINPQSLDERAQNKDIFSISKSYKEIEEIFKKYNLEIPSFFADSIDTNWEETKDIILDPDNKQASVTDARRLRSLGYQRLWNSVPVIDEDGKDTGLIKEQWGMPNITDAAGTIGPVDAGKLKGVIENSALKQASEIDQDTGKLAQPLRQEEVEDPHYLTPEHWLDVATRLVEGVAGFNPSTIGPIWRMLSPEHRGGGEGILGGAPNPFQAFMSSEHFAEPARPFLYGSWDEPGVQETVDLLAQRPDAKEGFLGDVERWSAAARQTEARGEIPWYKELITKALTDPIEYIPLGAVYQSTGRVFGLTAPKLLKQLSSIEWQAMDAAAALYKLSGSLGPVDNHLIPLIEDIRKTRAGINTIDPNDLRATINLNAYDPAVSISDFGENSIRLRQNLMDSGVVEAQADAHTRLIAQFSSNRYGNPDYLASEIQVKRVNDLAANNALELSIANDKLGLPQGYLFQSSENVTPPRDLFEFKHNTEMLLDYLESPLIENLKGSGIPFKQGMRRSGDNPSEYSFSRNGLLDVLRGGKNKTGIIFPENAQLNEFTGLRVPREEIEWLNLEDWVESFPGNRITVGDIRSYIDGQKLKIEHYSIIDPYAGTVFNSSTLPGARTNGTAIVLRLAVEDMGETSLLRRYYLPFPEEKAADKILTRKGTWQHTGDHYEQRYLDAAMDRFVPTQIGASDEFVEVPTNMFNNILMHARTSNRVTTTGRKATHGDEFQADPHQSEMRRNMSHEDFNEQLEGFIVEKTGGKHVLNPDDQIPFTWTDNSGAMWGVSASASDVKYNNLFNKQVLNDPVSTQLPDNLTHSFTEQYTSNDFWIYPVNDIARNKVPDLYQNITQAYGTGLQDITNLMGMELGVPGPLGGADWLGDFVNTNIMSRKIFSYDVWSGKEGKVARQQARTPSNFMDLSMVRQIKGVRASTEHDQFWIQPENFHDQFWRNVGDPTARLEAQARQLDTGPPTLHEMFIPEAMQGTPIIRLRLFEGDKTLPYLRHPDSDGTSDIVNEFVARLTMNRKLEPLSTDIRWSPEDIAEGKAGFIIKELKLDPFYRRTIEPAGTWGVFDGNNLWGTYHSKKEASEAVWSWLTRTWTSRLDVPLPPRLPYKEGWEGNIIKHTLIEAALNGSDDFTWSTSNHLLNRYGKKAGTYGPDRYGDAGISVPGRLAGSLREGVVKSITSTMRLSGWRGWTKEDSIKLIGTRQYDTGIKLLDSDFIMNISESLEASSYLGYRAMHNGPEAVNMHDGIGNLIKLQKRQLFNISTGKPYPELPQDEFIKYANDLLDISAHSNYNISYYDYDEQIRYAMSKVSEDAFWNAHSKYLDSIIDDPSKNADLIAEVNDIDGIAKELFAVAGQMQTSKIKLIAELGNYTKRYIKIPDKILDTNFTTTDFSSTYMDSQEILGLPYEELKPFITNRINLQAVLEKTGMPQGISSRNANTDRILNKLVQLVIESSDDIDGATKRLIHSAVGAKPYAQLDTVLSGNLTDVHAVSLTDDLLAINPKTKLPLYKELGIKATPIGPATKRTFGEALINVKHTMFQVQGGTPNGGTVLGFTDFMHGGKYIVNITDHANINTYIHEISHIFRRNLSMRQLDIAGELFVGKDEYASLANRNIWPRQAEERFADAFVEYMDTGFAKNDEVRGIFAQLKDWLTSVFRSIKGSPVEENLSPKVRELFDELVQTRRPSERQINSAIPAHLISKAMKFYGHRVDDYTVSSDQSSNEINRLFQTTQDAEPEPVVAPLVEELSTVQDMEDVITANFIMDNYRKLAELPGLQHILKRFNPTVAATDPLVKSLIGQKMLRAEGEQKAQIAFSRLRRLGSQDAVFGGLDDNGRLVGGKLDGFNVNDIRSNVSKYDHLLTQKQREWIKNANEIEEAKYRLLTSEGIDIKKLEFEDGGAYAGRTVMGKMLPTGELMSVALVQRRVGRKLTGEQPRFFETEEEGIAAGYRYLNDDETLLRNLQGAYNRIADKRTVEYITNRVVSTRTTALPASMLEAKGFAQSRLDAARKLIEVIQNSKRGMAITVQTRKSIEKWLPEIDGMLDDVSAVTLDQLVKAGRIAADQPMSWTPTKGMIKALFKRVKQLEDEIEVIRSTGAQPPHELLQRYSTMRRKLGFSKHAVAEAYKNYAETGVFEYTFSRSATSILVDERIGALQEVLNVVRGVPIKVIRGGKTVTRYRGGLIEDLQAEVRKADDVISKNKDKFQKAHIGEGDLSLQVPAFAGKIFTQDQPTNLGFFVDPVTGVAREYTGADVAYTIGKSMVQDETFNKFLSEVNTANSAFRFFQLAGDMSMFGIQLLFLMGHAVFHPTYMPKILKAFGHAFVDPKVHAKYLHDHRKLLSRHPGVMLSSGGTEMTEFTRNMANAGFVRAKPIKMAADVIGHIPTVKTLGRGYVGFLRRAQSGFESAIDIAGIEMLRTLDNFDSTGVRLSPIETQQMDDFVNEFRGLANTARLGTTITQRQLESLVLLAPRYNRAIAAMVTDIFHNNIRGQQARQKLASGVAAIMAMSAVFSWANGEDPDEWWEHYDWRSPKFFTWNIAGQNIGFGSKIRSLLKLAGTIHVAIERGDEEIDVNRTLMDIPGMAFLRGNMSPVLSTTTDMLTGRSYMGDPVWGESIWDIKGHIENFTKEEIAPKTMPIWAQSVLMEGGNVRERTPRGVAEFLGGRGYPESSYQMMQNFSQEILGLPYEELEPFERRLLRDVLSPELEKVNQDLIRRGNKKAQYWDALKLADENRYKSEEKLLYMFYHPRQYPVFFENGRRTLTQEYSRIQNAYAIARARLNKQFAMYQDDQEFDEDDPGKFIMQEWYELYDQATYGYDPDVKDEGIGGTFDPVRLAALQKKFWKKTLPNGQKYTEYGDYIRRNTVTTEHPPGYYNLLSRSTVSRWRAAEAARNEFLDGRGNWATVLKKK